MFWPEDLLLAETFLYDLRCLLCRIAIKSAFFLLLCRVWLETAFFYTTPVN